DALARSLFPNFGAIGRRVRVVTRQTPPKFEIVGIVADAPYRCLDEPHQPTLVRAFPGQRLDSAADHARTHRSQRRTRGRLVPEHGFDIRASPRQTSLGLQASLLWAAT